MILTMECEIRLKYWPGGEVFCHLLFPLQLKLVYFWLIILEWHNQESGKSRRRGSLERPTELSQKLFEELVSESINANSAAFEEKME